MDYLRYALQTRWARGSKNRKARDLGCSTGGFFSGDGSGTGTWTPHTTPLPPHTRGIRLLQPAWTGQDRDGIVTVDEIVAFVGEARPKIPYLQHPNPNLL